MPPGMCLRLARAFATAIPHANGIGLSLAISDDESDQGLKAPAASNRSNQDKKPNVEPDVDSDEEDEGDVPETNGAPGDEDEEDADGLEEEEYVVELIAGHTINGEGEPLFHVKWEGYEKKSDMTWEPEDNLKENASSVLDEYFLKIGGREKLFDQTAAALKTKKRGRPSSGTAQATKRAKKNGHPADEEEPLTARVAQWRPPAGSWEEEISQLDACEDEDTGKLMVYLTWKNGAKTQHETSVIYKRCPQKMLQFYERHVRIIKREPGESDE
ncbi:hypothetical protein GQ53DRAFT_784238 [Thozetella sp. PMI_491]|nr:hypothetical protein GQ53DRAFT_784238 [Thozetella sp. PMI_491]